MDLKSYYKKIQDLESTIAGEDVYVVSLATPNGGKAGVLTQMPRRAGAQMVIDGKARLAETAEIQTFEDGEAKRRAEIATEEIASRIEVKVIGKDETSGKPARVSRT